MRHAHRVERVAMSLVILTTLGSGGAAAQIDLSGEWAARLHEEVLLRRDPPGPSIGDYTGLPVDDAARLKADSWDASVLSVREHQTTPGSNPYLHEFADRVTLPYEATRGGARTMYPEYQQRLKELTRVAPIR